MASGYWHLLLRIDLTSGSLRKERITDETLRTYIGGAGFGAKILWDEVAGKTDAFAPQNKLIFATGPFQGTRIPGSAKFSISAISPLTCTYADTAAGGGWGPALKEAGFDALVIEGESAEPVMLVVKNGEARLTGASAIWGRNSYETVKVLHEQDQSLSVCAIGQAGERLVRFANIVVDGYSFGGRTGLGAVMGAKKLKAVAVGGSLKAPPHDADRLAALTKELSKEIYTNALDGGFREHGTPSIVPAAENFGDMPIKNWSDDTWPEGAALLGAENYTKTLQAKPKACRFCPVGCHRHITISEPAKYKLSGPGPEYETVGMMGTNCYVSDIKAVAKANEIANQGGMDSISTGATIGFAMECFEKGWLTTETTGGLDLSWGNGDALVKLTEMIVAREGLGDLLAEGALRAARKIHPEAEDLVAHCKGLEFPAHDPRACWSLAPNYATGTRGACHIRGLTEDIEMFGLTVPEIGVTEGVVSFFKRDNMALVTVKMQDYNAMVNSVVVCLFMSGLGLSMTKIAGLYNAATGEDASIADLMTCGERIYTVQRLINVRDGYDASTDKLPPKAFQVASKGARKAQKIPFRELMKDYYAARGWGADGNIPPGILTRLGI